MVSARLSRNMRAVETRIKRLPSIMIDQMKARAKKDAMAVIENFQTGIKENLLRLEPLKQSTVKKKQAAGLENSMSPLYGLGFDDPNSYVNCLEVKLVGNRLWAVRPREDWHHGKGYDEGATPEPRIRLRDLFDVHEHGAVINNAFGKAGVVVRIPPRPALRYAYKAYMAERAKADPAVKVRAAIAKHVQDGDRAALARISAKLAAGEEP